MFSNEPHIDLFVSASPLTEISIADARFRQIRLDENTGSVSTALQPGVYTVRFKEGDRVEEKTAVLAPDGPPVEVRQDAPLLFESAVPLADTSTTHKSHMDPAVDLSRADPHLVDGMGSVLTILVRDPGTPRRERRPIRDPRSRVPPDVAERMRMLQADPFEERFSDGMSVDPTLGLSLHRIDGTEIAPVAAGMSMPVDRVGGLKVGVDPGLYRLRVDTGLAQLLEMPVVAINGYQTMVFLVTRPYYANGASDVRADFDTASVSILGEDAPEFDPSSPDGRYTELALQALVGSRALRGNELKQILERKYQNPMLGVYGGHLLLDQPDPDVDLINKVIANTEDLIPGQSDVRALQLRASFQLDDGEVDLSTPFNSPPTLAVGWQQVVRASRIDPNVVPVGSLSDRISDRIARSGPWLVWADPPELDEPRQMAPDDPAVSDDGVAVDRLRDALQNPGAQEWAASTDALDAVQRALSQAIVPETDPMVRRMAIEMGGIDGIGTPPAISDDELSRELNLPVGSMRRLAGELDQELKRR